MGHFLAMANHPQYTERRDRRDVLRFIYQTTSKGRGKSYQDWVQSWRQCQQESLGVQANSTEGALSVFMSFFAKRDEDFSLNIFIIYIYMVYIVIL